MCVDSVLLVVHICNKRRARSNIEMSDNGRANLDDYCRARRRERPKFVRRRDFLDRFV
jgi:hypothetical protein